MSSQGRQGWGSAYRNARWFGREQLSGPEVSMIPGVLPCRKCDKVFLSTRSLIDHYESHNNDQNHPRTTRNAQNSASYQQRYHPYFPNAVANANSSSSSLSFRVPTQNPEFNYQTRNGQVSSVGTTTSQFPVPSLGASTSMNNNSNSNSNNNATTLLHQKGYDPSGDKRTIWYLGQLDQPIRKIVDLESNDYRRQELVKLNLRR